MPQEDALRWDSRYQQDPRYASFARPRPFLVQHAGLLPTHGLAFDAAMGLGGNAGFLLERGLQVVGVDISRVALQLAKNVHPQLWAVQADLTQFALPPNSFDVILNFYYLQRDLWPRYIRALRPGGILVFETLTQAMNERKPDVDPVYLLAPGELQSAFPGLEILAYQEGWVTGERGYPRAVASLLARAPIAE